MLILTFRQMPELDLNVVTKPGFRSFAPGSLDKAEISGRGPTFGVSSTLWKGSSGGPCFFLDGKLAGVIIGLGKHFPYFPSYYNVPLRFYLENTISPPGLFPKCLAA